MQTVTLGEKIKFRKSFYNDAGAFDPGRVLFTIYRVVNLPTFGPYVYDTEYPEENRYVKRVAPGTYEIELTVPQQTMPGIYTAEWQALIANDIDGGDANLSENSNVIDGGIASTTTFETTFDGSGDFDTTAQFSRTEFQILERLPEPSGLLEPGNLYGIILPTTTYNEMGIGLTSQLCIVGHCSGLNINEPYQVANMQEAINLIGANQFSPMVRYLTEASNAGARDIWLVASAPEREYVEWDSINVENRLTPRPEFGGRNFYEQYYLRYIETMQALSEHDFPDIIVAPDAPFYNTGGVDFLTPLVESCVDGFVTTGRFRIGFIGTLMGTNYTEADLNAIQNDERLDNYGQDGKTVGVFVGEGTVNTPNLINAYANSCVNIVAATATLDPFRGVMYQPLRGLVSPIGRDIPKEWVNDLANTRINSLIRTSLGKRGEPYNTVVATDNLLASDDSAFWALPQMRIVQEVVKGIRTLGYRRIGSVDYQIFKRDVEDYIRTLIYNDQIRDGTAIISRSIEDPYTIEVEVILKPYYGLREIVFTVGVTAAETLDRSARSVV